MSSMTFENATTPRIPSRAVLAPVAITTLMLWTFTFAGCTDPEPMLPTVIMEFDQDPLTTTTNITVYMEVEQDYTFYRLGHESWDFRVLQAGNEITTLYKYGEYEKPQPDDTGFVTLEPGKTDYTRTTVQWNGHLNHAYGDRGLPAPHEGPRAEPGPYSINAVYAGQAELSVSKVIHVASDGEKNNGEDQNRPPIADAGVNQSEPWVSNQINELEFNGNQSFDPDGAITEYCWDFGDNSTESCSSEPTTSHTYDAPGTYRVTLRVTDNEGAVGTHQVTVTIWLAPGA